jgi:hypothetical protein
MADKTKLNIKKLLKKIDSDSSCTVKFEVFANLLELHQVKLSPSDLKKLRLESRAQPKVGCGDASDSINFKAALRLIDMQTDALDPSQKHWCLKNANATAFSIHDSASMASSAFPGNHRGSRKNFESRDF